MPETLYAHTRRGCPVAEWEPLADHLAAVADRAAGFAEAFGGDRLSAYSTTSARPAPGFRPASARPPPPPPTGLQLMLEHL
jgi:hypothetical protein